MRPLILITPSTSPAGAEMADHSTSVSSRYLDAVLAAGGVPVSLPLTTDREVLADAVAQASGVLFSGGDDIDPRRYWPEVQEALLATCDLAEPARDVMELALLAEIFRQRKPLLAICRGHQLVNVFLGGTLYVDLPTQVASAVAHNQMDLRNDVAHQVDLPADSRFAAISGTTTLGVNSTHHQAIHRLASPLRASATAPDGVVEAAELGSEGLGLLPWFQSVQYHPERLAAPEHARLFRAFVEACRTPDR